MKNEKLDQLIRELKKTSSTEGVKLWRAVALELEKPTRSRRTVNLSKIERYAKDNETVLVPGKVLGGGELNKKLKIVAYQFSDQAISKLGINHAITIQAALKENPKGKNIRILG